MAKKCGCTNSQCACKFQDTTSVTWDGFGTTSDPFTPNLTPPLQVTDTSSLDLTLEQGEDGLVLSGAIVRAISAQRYEANATWTKPAGVNACHVILIGGGGGGGAGRWENGTVTNVITSGGGGGFGGCVTSFTLYGSEIPSSAAVVIGTGGAGGIVPATMGNNGGAGGAGGDTTFSNFRAKGGVGGAGGTNANLTSPTFARAAAAGGTAQGGMGGPFYSGILSPEAWPHYLAPGGGSQGSTVAANTSVTPNSLGGFCLPGMGARSQSAVQATTPGQNGYDQPVTLMGSGGCGGNSTSTIKGGNGGLYGAGGGGGAGVRQSSSPPSGAGGTGAHGICIVIAW